MLDVYRMQPHTTETLRCESYTTPRSVRSENNLEKFTYEDAEEADDSGATARFRNGVNREGVRSAPSHFSPQVSQTLTEKLLLDSEKCSLDDILVFESLVLDDWSEAATGWRVVVPYPKYVTSQPPTRIKSDSLLKKGSLSERTAVRCVDDEFNRDQLSPWWKANVEPVTYRYVPNNGHYRNNKSDRNARDLPGLRKSKSEKLLLTPEMRQAQKTLKRDLEIHFKGANDENSTIPNTAQLVQSQEPAVKPEQTPTFTPTDSGVEITHVVKRLPAKEQQLIKSASDLFMEKFNTRLNALKKEYTTPRNPSVTSKGTDTNSVNNHSLATKKIKEVRVTETMKPTIQNGKTYRGNFGEDLFTVIPMCKPEVPLRPLEKLTPQQKQMEKIASRERSPSPGFPSQVEDELEGDVEEDMMIMLASATTQPHSLPKDVKSSGISTARSAIAMTNFDIEKTRNVSLRSDFVGDGKPKPFVVHKGSGSPAIRRGAVRYTMTNSEGHVSDHTASVHDEIPSEEFSACGEGPVEKQYDSVGPTLPEIMGKRLSVITTTHRLL